MSASDKANVSDEEKNVAVEVFVDSSSGSENVPLQRKMKSRHIAMISIGGVIGTGLFLGTATSLHNGGPVGLLLGYSVVGTICYSVMISLGEMVTYLPIPGGHIAMAGRFVDPAFSFTMGWNFWYAWTILLPTELSAASVLMDYWDKTTSNAVWITMCLVIVIVINLFGAGVYGECEFIFASIKVVTVTGLIILGIILDLGGGPNHDRIGFRYWKNPGPFVQYNGITGTKGRFLGWVAVLIQAGFSYTGTEIVGIAAAETKNPKDSIAKAIRRVYVRILLFYVGGTFVMGLLVPSSDSRLQLDNGNSAASPFVIAINNAGIRALPSIINACLLTSAWSASTSDLYVSSRSLYGLAASGHAPKIFLKTSSKGVPWVAISFCAIFSLLAYMGIQTGSGRVFNWFVNMTAVSGLMTWFGICYTYTRFRKGLLARDIDRSQLPYHSRIQPFAAWYALTACLVICTISGWEVFLKDNWSTSTFITNYLPLAWFPVVYFTAKSVMRVQLIKPSDMDFTTGLVEVEDNTGSGKDSPSDNTMKRIWEWLM